MRARALILNNQADGEIERGNLAEAERLYGEALAAARSIEDEPRIAVNLLGLAATLRAAGRGKEAGALLDELLGSPTGRFPAELVAQASLQKAVIALDEERPADAAASVQRSLSDCASPRSCSQVATAHVLMARARLAQGDAAAAVAEAKTGLDVARARRERREEANALRLLGDAALALGGGAGGVWLTTPTPSRSTRSWGSPARWPSTCWAWPQPRVVWAGRPRRARSRNGRSPSRRLRATRPRRPERAGASPRPRPEAKDAPAVPGGAPIR